MYEVSALKYLSTIFVNLAIGRRLYPKNLYIDKSRVRPPD